MKYLICLVLFVAPTLVHAKDTYLSRDFCRFEFESARLHNGQRSVEMLEPEIVRLIGNVRAGTKLECIKRFDEYKSTAGKRQRPKKERCSILPNKYWSDRHGHVLYKSNQSGLKRMSSAFEPSDLGRCLKPLLNY